MWVCSCFLNFFERIFLIGRWEALASIARLIDEWGEIRDRDRGCPI
ncbi:hypothetical protein RRSWK_02304 [Rhodopirellula sp. SWK7]|nr:hypothetical protein RRSWK_02304 [Rhodopirellula sp. SWK7]